MEYPAARHRRQVSPERTIVWKEPPVKHKKQPLRPRIVPVVYCLYRNNNLDQPHFMEVPLASADGLYLRDFIEHLTLLRGNGMPTMYSWSCKRSYKNSGFVWHDLAEDDLVIPAHGDDYILKGTELLDHSFSDRINRSPIGLQLQNPIHPHPRLRSPASSNAANSSSLSPDFIAMEAKHARSRQEHELSPSHCQRGSHPFAGIGSQDLVENKVHKPNGLADASTQTEEGRGRNACQVNTCNTSVLTDDDVFDLNFGDGDRNQTTCSGEGSVYGKNVISLSPISSTASSPFPKMDTLHALIRAEARRMNGKMDTLHALIRAEARSMNGYGNENVPVHMKAKQKATHMLLPMITCGLISKKDHHNFGFIQTYKQRVSHVMVPSTMFTSSMILREFDLSENLKVRGLRQADRKHYSVRPDEAKQEEEEEGEGKHTHNHSSCYYVDRTRESPESLRIEQKLMNLIDSKLPRSTKFASCKQLSDARNMSVRLNCRPLSSSKGGSRRVTDTCSKEESSMRLGPFKQ